MGRHEDTQVQILRLQIELAQLQAQADDESLPRAARWVARGTARMVSALLESVHGTPEAPESNRQD